MSSQASSWTLMEDFFVQECCVHGTDLENHGPTLILCDDPLPIESTLQGSQRREKGGVISYSKRSCQCQYCFVITPHPTLYTPPPIMVIFRRRQVSQCLTIDNWQFRTVVKISWTIWEPCPCIVNIFVVWRCCVPPSVTSPNWFLTAVSAYQTEFLIMAAASGRTDNKIALFLRL